MAKKFKTKFSYDMAVNISTILEKIIREEKDQDAGTRLMLSGFAEVMLIVRKKLIEYQREYKLTFTPVQAHALRLLYTEYIATNGNNNGYMENRLLLISNEIHQQFEI